MILLLSIMLNMSVAWADVTGLTGTNAICTQLDAVLREKKQLFSKTFPDVYFLVLRGGESWTDDMVGLSVLLGHQPVNLDYEHPTELREELMFVSLERLALMLRYQMPSASLDWPLKYVTESRTTDVEPARIPASPL